MSHERASRAAAVLFRRQRRRLASLLPAAEVFHIGSTAIRGALTKGDLDIVVRVRRADFSRAERVLGGCYARNTGSHRNRTFASFVDDSTRVPLGIQLVVRGGPEDNFLTFRDALRADPALVRRYNQLKRRCVGLPMGRYRQRKSAFIQRVLAAGRRRSRG